MNRALAITVVLAAVSLAVIDFVVGFVLGVTDFSPPRILWALGVAAWAYIQLRRAEPQLFPLLAFAALVTATGSLVVPVLDPDFRWYDEYTAYGILLGVGILSSVVTGRSRVIRVAIWAVPALWAFAFGVLDGRPLDHVLDWTIVAAATVAILHHVVRRLLDAATAAADSQDEMVGYHRALARCSHVLLEDDSDSALNEALAALLAATAADYASIDRTVYEEKVPGFEIVAEASTGPVPERAEWMSGSYADLPTFLAAHQAGQVCAVSRDELEDDAERSLYERDGIEAELSVPIMVEGTWRGCLALAQFRSSRRWTAVEIDMMMQAASMVAAYWKRGDDRRRLEEAIRSKDDLIASVSHELRTPLTGVVGLAEEMAVSADEFDAQTMAELAGVVADQSRELAHLVEDLLVAARVDSGRLTIRSTEVALLEEARSIVDSVAGASTITVEGWEGKALADPLRCRQIIRNLVTNAIRYGGREVSLSVIERPEDVLLAVIDDGGGVPEADIDRIFQPYERSRLVAPGSVGVGLSVSRNLARLMGGTLEYQRRSGRTEFRLSLPHVPSLPTPEREGFALAMR